MSDSPVLIDTIDGSPLGVSFVLPTFWRTDPPLWFAHAEAQFFIHRVDAQEVRFAHVITALQPDVAKELREIILNPPSTGSYETIKQQLCSMTDTFRENHIRQQTADEQLGNDSPTSLLRRLRERLDPTTDEEHLKALLVEKLPLPVRNVVEPVCTELDTLKVAQLADRMMSLRVIDSDHANQEESIAGQIDQLRKTLYDLKSVVKQLSTYIETTTTNRKSDGSIKICWYHRRYGGKAHRCAPSCALSQPLASPAHLQSDDID